MPNFNHIMLSIKSIAISFEHRSVYLALFLFVVALIIFLLATRGTHVGGRVLGYLVAILLFVAGIVVAGIFSIS
jgi:energy-coupling factor transporter transmembrane protein EcfT